MTATLVPTVPTTTDAPARSLLRAGIVAGLVAAVATTAIAAIAHAAGVSLETAPGEQMSPPCPPRLEVITPKWMSVTGA